MIESSDWDTESLPSSSLLLDGCWSLGAPFATEPRSGFMAHGLTPPSWLRQPLAVGVHSSLSPSPSFFFLFYSRRVGCAPVVHGCERMPSASLHSWSGTQEWVGLACFVEKS